MTTKVIFPNNEQNSSLWHSCAGVKECQICQLAEQLHKKTKILSRIEAECKASGRTVGTDKILKILEGEK